MIRLTAILGFLFVLGACSNVEHEDLKEWMRTEAKGMKGRVPRLPEIKAFPFVAYETQKASSPFSATKIVTVEAMADKAAPDRDRPRQPLESFPLEDLKVTGIVLTGKAPVALVQPPPPNKPKPVRVGEFMGQNFGRVTQISSDSVTVLETIKDTNGSWTDREIQKLVPRQGGR